MNDTLESIQRLQIAASSLAAVKEPLPGLRLAMYTDHYHIYNSNMEIVFGSGGASSQGRIEVDWANLHRATVVFGSASPGSVITAWLQLDGLPNIPLLRIRQPSNVVKPKIRGCIMVALANLPEGLRWQVYKMLASRLCQHRRGQKRRVEELRRELDKLEGK